MEVIKITYPSQSKYALIGQETPGTAGTSGTALAFGGWLSGTAGTSTPNDVGVIIKDVSENMTREVIESLGLSRIQTQKITSGMTESGVSIEGDFQHGRLFKYIVGPESAAENSGDYTHTFGIAQNPPAATIQSGNNLTTDTILKHVGQFIESAELSIALNENLKLRVDFKGKTSYNPGGNAPTAVLSTLPVFPHSLCEVKINGTAATEVQNASIRFVKTISKSGGISSNIYQQGHATELKFEFSANLGFTASTYQDLFMGGTAVSGVEDPTVMEFEINADNRVVSGSGQIKIICTLENCIHTTFDETAAVGGLVFITIAGKGTLKTLQTIDNIASL